MKKNHGPAVVQAISPHPPSSGSRRRGVRHRCRPRSRVARPSRRASAAPPRAALRGLAALPARFCRRGRVAPPPRPAASARGAHPPPGPGSRPRTSAAGTGPHPRASAAGVGRRRPRASASGAGPQPPAHLRRHAAAGRGGRHAPGSCPCTREDRREKSERREKG